MDSLGSGRSLDAMSDSDPLLQTSGDEKEKVLDDLSIELVPAPLFKRTLAIMVDFGIITIAIQVAYFAAILIFLALAASFGLLLGDWAKNSETGPIFVMILMIAYVSIALLAIFSLLHGYFIYFEYKKGQTLGKKLFGLRVVSMDHLPLTFNQCVIREVMRWVDFTLVIPGLVAAIASRKSQRLGDMMANTMVVHSSTAEEINDYLYVTQSTFEKLNELVEMPELSPSIARPYLNVAYPLFITGRMMPYESDMDAWRDRFLAMASYPEGALDDIELDTIMRFFAEHCRRVLNKKQ